MNLHRVSGKADWDSINPSSYNLFQKIAASTYAIITPANIISFVGLGSIMYGLGMVLNNQWWLGILLLTFGRLLDILDGAVAEATKTKSPLGEVVDAVADKVGTVLTIAVLFMAHITNWWVLGALLLPQILIPIVIFYKKQQRIRVHPTRSGKLSMAMTWSGIVGLVIVKALNGQVIVAIVVSLFIGLSLLLGLYALWQYATGRD